MLRFLPLKLVFMLLICGCQLHAHSVREVHIAFVDEELSAILKAVMERELSTRDKTVVVLERGELREGDLLFEQELGYYDPAHKMRIETQVYTAGQASGNARMQGIVDGLQRMICQSDEAASSRSLTIPFFPRKLGETPTFSTVSFMPEPSAAGSQDVIYIVRSPEMGLQPQLTYVGLKVILEQLTAGSENAIVSQFAAGANFDLAVKPGPLADFKGEPAPMVSQLAAGGAIDLEVKPGEVSRVAGSLYIGIELLENEQGDAYFQSRIALASMLDGSDKDYLVGPKYYLALHTDMTPFEVYKRAMEDLDNSVMNLVRDQQLGDLSADIAAIEAAGGPGSKVSLSTSFFTGDMYKDFGRAVGTNCVSMEDYHLIRALWDIDASGRLAAHSLVMRQSEDPAAIPHEVEDSFSQYLKGTKGTHPRRGYPQLSRGGYKAVLAWGLVHGRDYNKLPAAAAWEWPEKIIADDPKYRELFYPLHTEDGRLVYLNPFVEEIASDLLNQAQHGDFLREAMVNRSVLQELQQQSLRSQLFPGQLDLANSQLAEQAAQISHLGARIRRMLMSQDSELETELAVLDERLHELTASIDYVGGLKTRLRPEASLPSKVRTVLADPEFQEAFMPSILGLADLQCQSPLLTWTPKRRARFDHSMLEHFLAIQEDYLLADDPDSLDVLELLGLRVHKESLLEDVHPSLLHGFGEDALEEFSHELRASLRKLKGDFVRILRNRMTIRPETSIQEIASSELLSENYNGILYFFRRLFEGHFPLPRIGLLAKKRSGIRAEGDLSVWVRPYKWARNEAGLANHLPSNFILSDEDLLEKLFSNYALQSSILDRCLYKATLGPAIKEAAMQHVRKTVPALRQQAGAS